MEVSNDRVDIIIIVDDENDETIGVGFWYCSTAGTAPEKNQNIGVDAREIVNMRSDGAELVQKTPWKFAVEFLLGWKGTYGISRTSTSGYMRGYICTHMVPQKRSLRSRRYI